MSQLNTKPYILRALYEWCTDSGYTPHIAVWVNEQTQVPMQYVHDNEIVLNVGANASHNLTIDNEWIHFSARFNGQAEEIWIPVGHVKSLFARETGEGMAFEVVPLEKASDHTEDTADTEKPAGVSHSSKDKAAPKKGLKIIK
ncbi:ClpXP protease specificity-enhancing factor [Neisseriaceae bacterium ESL0693]|nr:ClpXP protease specificity-enhancing factor [Neisseriaceae bacterium ESL0693]